MGSTIRLCPVRLPGAPTVPSPSQAVTPLVNSISPQRNAWTKGGGNLGPSGSQAAVRGRRGPFRSRMAMPSISISMPGKASASSGTRVTAGPGPSVSPHRSRQPVQEIRLIDRSVGHVKHGQLDQIGHRRSGFIQERCHMGHAARGLRVQIARIELVGIGVQIDLAADENHPATADTVVVVDVEPDAPVPLRLDGPSRQHDGATLPGGSRRSPQSRRAFRTSGWRH